MTPPPPRGDFAFIRADHLFAATRGDFAFIGAEDDAAATGSGFAIIGAEDDAAATTSSSSGGFTVSLQRGGIYTR